MKSFHFSFFQRLLRYSVPVILCMITSLFFFPSPSVLAQEHSDEEAYGIQAFWNFFGPDGVNECLEPDEDDRFGLAMDLPALYSNDYAVLTTTWETVGGGRINRKYLNGLVAFCYDEELAFPNGAIYTYATASNATLRGQAAAIAQRFAQSGVDNAQWWSECQVAIWAVRAGCRTYDSAAAFARAYCADRKITDAATVADYAYIVGTLVAETSGANGTAYLYQAADPANQRLLTCFSVWPDPAPTYPSPKYDKVSVTETYTASREHRIVLDAKSASIPRELLEGAMFQVYENDQLVGTIVTDPSGTGSCQWTYEPAATATITKDYCSNYDLLDPATRKTITGFTNREDAYAAAKQEALTEAGALAETLADTPCTITIRESTVPVGFSPSDGSTQTITLTSNDSATISAINVPWSATFLLHKADSITGEIIAADASFILYEWNGTEYVISPHYEVLRREDGVYTVASHYPEGQPETLYYTQQNQGRFALVETEPPYGYLLDPLWFFFTITENGQTILAHNAAPEDYPLNDPDKFVNQAVTGTILITKTGDYLSLPESDHTNPFSYISLPVSQASFAIYNSDHVLVGTITTDDSGVARLEQLPLGTYTIQEVSAGNGEFLLDPTITTVTLSYLDPFTAVILDDSTHYHNLRQTISLRLSKTSCPLGQLPLPEEILSTLSEEMLTASSPLSGAVYGLYAAEDIYGYQRDESSGSVIQTEEPVIPAHTLLEQATTDTNGEAIFQSDIPCGQYYLRELQAPAGYLPDDEIYPIDAGYTGQDGPAVLEISRSLMDDPICLIVTKIDSKEQQPLAGASLALYYLAKNHEDSVSSEDAVSFEDAESSQEVWEQVATWTSQETPTLLWGLPAGTYRLEEIQAPHGYQLAEPVIFSIPENTPLFSIQMINTPIPPQPPRVPSSDGAPTGDDSPILPATGCLMISTLVILSLGCGFFRRKR